MKEEKTIVEELGGTSDVIGLDVIQINKKMDDCSIENAKKVFEDNSRDVYKVVEINDEQFLIKATLANLNEVTTVIPEDMENNISMRIQLAIADVLTEAGLKVGTISDEEIEEADAKAAMVANEIAAATHKSREQSESRKRRANEGTDTEDVKTESDK